MPENFIQPVTDRQQCFTCHKTVTGKRKLSKCSKCHAITYCGAKCQKADWPRHRWNCIPVMVTEYEGKGRGVMAARDIKMGEVIFIDKPVVKVKMPSGELSLAEAAEEVEEVIPPSLKLQIENLSSEAKLQIDKFVKTSYLCVKDKLPEDLKYFSDHMEGIKELGLFATHSKTIDGWGVIFLNVALINHSCAPNATSETIQKDGDTWYEIRAFKDISKGEEVTLCEEVSMVGCTPQERRAIIRQQFYFDCKCLVCTGIIPDQEDIMKELLELHERFAMIHAREESSLRAKGVKIADKIVDLTQKLYIGPVEDKVWSLKPLLASANKLHKKKAQQALKKMAEDTGLESIRALVEICERATM